MRGVPTNIFHAGIGRGLKRSIANPATAAVGGISDKRHLSGDFVSGFDRPIVTGIAVVIESVTRLARGKNATAAFARNPPRMNHDGFLVTLRHARVKLVQRGWDGAAGQSESFNLIGTNGTKVHAEGHAVAFHD